MNDDTTARSTPPNSERRDQLLRLIGEGQLDDLAPGPADEDLLDDLGQAHHDACVYIEAWLTAAYLDGTGCYAGPTARAASRLPALVLGHADRRYACPPNCPRAGAECDGCAQACEGGAHRRRALLSRLFARVLTSRQRDSQRLLLTPVAEPCAPLRRPGRHRRRPHP
ncbi:hypothetical protein ACFXPX_13465 [Kitasatospora sp. NPDC059146]|uniref:hypothetical protein n=1 Tax=Kitasatospora sp. NPDC059146 TaxID=3346741 RepID=UPI00369BB6AF